MVTGLTEQHEPEGWINYLKESMERRSREAEDKLDTLGKVEQAKTKRLKGEKLTITDLGDIMDILCYKGLQYCCRALPEEMGKNCPQRNAALEALGLTLEDYEKYKMEFGHEVLTRILEEKGILK